MEKYSPAMPIGTTDQKIFEFLQLPEAFRGGKTINSHSLIQTPNSKIKSNFKRRKCIKNPLFVFAFGNFNVHDGHFT